MNDLISKKNLIKSIDYIGTPGGIWAKPFEAYKEAFKEFVKGMPSAEKKGKWEDIVELDSGGYPFKVGVCCSACGFKTLSEDNYCPYCGAKMEVTE